MTQQTWSRTGPAFYRPPGPSSTSRDLGKSKCVLDGRGSLSLPCHSSLLRTGLDDHGKPWEPTLQSLAMPGSEASFLPK